MTERQQQLIAYYLPHSRDPELDDFEYYVEDQTGKIQRGWLTDIMPYREDTLYRIVNKRGQIKSGNEYDAFYKWELYDNKQDCREHSHSCYNGWEELRELQIKENGQ